MNRPEKRNALNSEVRQELYNVLKRIDSDENIRSAIITGAGEAFIAGADIQAMKNYTVEDAIESSRQGSKVFSYIEKMGSGLWRHYKIATHYRHCKGQRDDLFWGNNYS